jgi:hypothetical protein
MANGLASESYALYSAILVGLGDEKSTLQTAARLGLAIKEPSYNYCA